MTPYAATSSFTTGSVAGTPVETRSFLKVLTLPELVRGAAHTRGRAWTPGHVQRPSGLRVAAFIRCWFV